MSSDDQHGRSTAESGAEGLAPTPEDTEAVLSYEAFEARAKELHGEPATAAAARDAESAASGPETTEPGTPSDEPVGGAVSAGMVDELRASGVEAAKGLVGLHLTSTDVAARALGGLVERAGDASGNERLARLTRGQAELLRRAASGYTSLGRRLLG